MSAVCNEIDQWPAPVPGQTLNLPVVGVVLQVRVSLQVGRPQGHGNTRSHWQLRPSSSRCTSHPRWTSLTAVLRNSVAVRWGSPGPAALSSSPPHHACWWRRAGWPHPGKARGLRSLQAWVSPGLSGGDTCCLGLAWWQPRPHSDTMTPSSQNLLPTPMVISSVHELDLFR